MDFDWIKIRIIILSNEQTEIEIALENQLNEKLIADKIEYNVK